MKTKLLLALLALMPLAYVSCQKLNQDDYLPDSAWFATADQIEDASAGTRRITVYATRDWVVTSSNPEWVSVAPTSGGQGVHELTVTFSANDGAQARVATIDCKAGDYTDTYTVTQKAK